MIFFKCNIKLTVIVLFLFLKFSLCYMISLHSVSVHVLVFKFLFVLNMFLKTMHNIVVYAASKVKHRQNTFLEKTVKLSDREFCCGDIYEKGITVTFYSQF